MQCCIGLHHTCNQAERGSDEEQHPPSAFLYPSTLMLLVANLANTKWSKISENDWNPGRWVLIWEHSSRAIQWIPTWQGLVGFQRCLRSCAFDESSLSIGRVKRKLLTHQTVFRPWGIVCLVAECEIAVYCRYNGKIRSNRRENCRSAALKNYADQLESKRETLMWDYHR